MLFSVRCRSDDNEELYIVAADSKPAAEKKALAKFKRVYAADDNVRATTLDTHRGGIVAVNLHFS